MRKPINAVQGERIGALAERLDRVERTLADERASPDPDAARVSKLERHRLHLKNQLTQRLSRSRKIRKARLAPLPGRSAAPTASLHV